MPASNSVVGKQREIGRKYRSEQERQRVIIGGIKKPGEQIQPDNIPKSILKKPTGPAKSSTVRTAKLQQPKSSTLSSRQPPTKPLSKSGSI